MKNPILLQNSDYKTNQEDAIRSILDQVPISIQSLDPRIPINAKYFPRISVKSNRGTMCGSFLTPIDHYEKFTIYPYNIINQYIAREGDVAIFTFSETPFCSVSFHNKQNHPILEINVPRGKVHRRYGFQLDIPLTQLVNALGEPMFNIMKSA